VKRYFSFLFAVTFVCSSRFFKFVVITLGFGGRLLLFGNMKRKIIQRNDNKIFSNEI